MQEKNNSKIGEKFQIETKYCRNKMVSPFDSLLKSKPQVSPNDSVRNKIILINIDNFVDEFYKRDSFNLHYTIKNRKSIRNYSSKPLSFEELSYLLYASCGKQRVEFGHIFRTVPSAGALYPIETYVLVNNVTNVENGIYHYNVFEHALEQIRVGNFGTELMHASLEQNMCKQAAVVFLWVAVFARSVWKYGQRAYRYIYLDAGHIAQNLALAAVALGLGSCQIAAFFDDEVNELIGIDGINESVIYMSSVGVPVRS